MSLLKELNSITESEKITLQELLLNRIAELTHARDKILEGLDEGYTTKAKIYEIEKLIKFNQYLFHWVEDPPSGRLQ